MAYGKKSYKSHDSLFLNQSKPESECLPQTPKANSKGLRALSLKSIQQNIPGLPKVPGQWRVIKTFLPVFAIKG